MVQIKGTLIFCSPNPINNLSPRQARELKIFTNENIPIIIVDSAWVYKGKNRDRVFPILKKGKVRYNGVNIDTYSVKMIILPLYRTGNNNLFAKTLLLVQIIPSLIIYTFTWFFTLLYITKKYNAKVIWCSNAPDLPCTIAGLLKLIFKNRFLYIYEMRELVPELYCIRLSENAHCTFYGFLRILEKISYSAADIVVTVSHAMKNYVTEMYKTKKVVIPVYPYPPIPEELLSKIRETSHLHKDSILAVYGGSLLDRIYDIDLLLRSLRNIYPEVKGKLKIIILGEGDSTIMRAIQQAKKEMPEIIELSKPLPRNEYYKLLEKSDLGIVPLALNQLTSVAIPNKLIDCILMEKPVITAALPSTIELSRKFNGILLYKSGCLYSLERMLLNITESNSTLKMINSKLENQRTIFSEVWNKQFYPLDKIIHDFMKS
jgi:hypothetical protein